MHVRHDGSVSGYPKVIALLLFVAIVAPVSAQTSSNRFLVPAFNGNPGVQGANGSVWITELTVRNDGLAPVRIQNLLPGCHFPCGNETFVDIPPNETGFIEPEGAFLGNGPGAIIEMGPGAADDLIFNLRVQDLSRQLSTWGTELAVVNESELLSGRSVLINIPAGEEFRHTLRVYEIDGATDAEFEVFLLAANPIFPGASIPPQPDQVLGSKRFRLTSPPSGEADRSPAYLEIGNLNDIAEIGGAHRLVVRVVPVNPNMRYWAFISVTNNETQHVTTILP